MWPAVGGGASSRAGTKFVGQARQSITSSYPPQLIPFQFSLDQGYVLVFSNNEMSVVANGAFVTEAGFTISAVTSASPGVFTAAGNDFVVGDWVYLSGLGGLTELNGGTFSVSTLPTTGSFTLQSTLTADPIDTTTYSAYTSGGTAAKLFVLSTPYSSSELASLKWAQSADVMSLTHPDHPPMDLTRVTVSNWTLTTTSFSASISPPTTTAVAALTAVTSSQATQYAYVVTAVDSQTGEESTSSIIARNNNSVNIATTLGSEKITWSAVTGAQYYNVYKATPCVGGAVPVGAPFGFIGQAFGTAFVDTNIQQDFTITPPWHQNPFAPGQVDYIYVTSSGTSYSEYNPPTVNITGGGGSGATAQAVVNNGGVSAVIVLTGGSGYTTSPTVTFSAAGSGSGFVATAVSNGAGTWDGGGTANGTVTISATGSGYTSGAIVTARYTLLGSPIELVATSITVGGGGGITAVQFQYTAEGQKPVYTDVVISVPVGSGAGAAAHITATTGTYPSVVSYFQDRRFYANTTNQPDTYFASQPGAFTNFDRSIPTVDADAIVGTPWAQQVNGIQNLVPMPGGLVILTGLSAWQLNGGAAGAALTPIDQQASAQAYNGCHQNLPALTINYDILYVQAKGSIVRDLNYNLIANIYTGTDLTVLSSHLFNNRDIVRWAWAEEPWKLVWAVRDDGTALSLTYLKEQDIWAWARHDTNGLFQSVAAVTEPPVDAVYFVVKRFLSS